MASQHTVSKTLQYTGLENSTRLLLFTSASGCRASENFDISGEFFFPIYTNKNAMQGKCLFSDISRPEYRKKF